MMASIYPGPLDVDEVLELTGTPATFHRRTQSSPAGRPNVSASPSRSSAIRTCSSWTSRRSRWTSRAERASGSRCGTSQHPAGRSCSRPIIWRRPTPTRPDRPDGAGPVVADGPTTEIKATVGLRTIRATLPEADDRRARTAARRHQGRAARRGGRARLLRLRPGDQCTARRVPGARDIDIAGAGLEQAFLQFTADEELDD